MTKVISDCRELGGRGRPEGEAGGGDRGCSMAGQAVSQKTRMPETQNTGLALDLLAPDQNLRAQSRRT